MFRHLIKMNLVFTYGTLKRGQPNHYLFENPENGKMKFIGEGRTSTAYPLVIASRYNIPFLLNCGGKGKQVSGQIYEVDDKMLSTLDRLENHPLFYQRIKTQIIPSQTDNQHSGSTNQTIDCWCYFLIDFNPDLLKLPYLEAYDAYGSQGLKYVSHSERPKEVPKEIIFEEVKLIKDNKST